MGWFITWWTWCTLGLLNFASKCRLTHSFMNSQPNSKIPPPLDSHRQGLQITLRVGRKLVSSSVGALGAHSVYQILHQNVGSLIASWILNRIPKFHHSWIPTIEGYKSHSGLAKTGQFIGWWTWCTLSLWNFASKRRLAHSFMNSQLNSEIPPPLDSHRQGLQITLEVGRNPVGSLVGGLGAHSVYWILHENVGSLIASWILNQIPKFYWCWIPAVKGSKLHSGPADNWWFHQLVHLVHPPSIQFWMNISAHS